MNESIVTELWDQLRQTPERGALYDGTNRWTYRELHTAANRIAGRLQREGVGPGDRVGICMPRTNDAIAAILGVLIAGGAYVPLDPGYPGDRLAYMCEHATAKVVLGPPKLTEGLPVDAVLLDPSGAAQHWELPDGQPPAPDPASAAYVLFTSGSTGLPKGVQVSHRNVVALLGWARETFSADELAVGAVGAPFSFDISVFEIFAPLTRGGMLRILPNGLAMGGLGPDDLITFAFTTPSILGELVHAERLPASLRTLVVGGEVFPSALANAVLIQMPRTRLLTVYGPTEATVLTTAAELSFPTEDPLPIGRDLPGSHNWILDDHVDPVADGTVGEIFIAGDQVADGYLKDPERTAERFINWTPGAGPAQRLYRSGDLGSRRADGLVEFHGRSDHQIKLRGYRIEPGEIETVMCRYPGVAQAFVRAVNDGPAAKLVGYFVPVDRPVVIEDLMAALRGALAPYMVPARLVSMARFPLTARGKLDESALPPWSPSPSAPAKGAVVLQDVEETVASLVGELLGIDRPIGAEDDFMDDLGGTSLEIVRLLSTMEQTFGCRLPIDRVVSDTTVTGLANLVRQRGGAEASRMVVHGDGSKAPLFLFHAYLGGILRYRRLSPYLSPDRPIVAMDGHDPAGGADGATTIEEMASRVISQVRQIQPRGPYVIGGHSAGGLIAFELACQLIAAGDEVQTLIMLDSPVSSPRWRYYWAEVALNWPEMRHAPAAERMARLRRMIGSRLVLHRHVRDDDRVAMTIERNNRLSNLACLRYVTPHYPGDITVLRSEQGVRMAAGNRSLGWARHVAGTVTCLDIDGGHNTMFDPEFVASLAGRINQVLGDTLPGSVAASAPEPGSLPDVRSP